MNFKLLSQKFAILTDQAVRKIKKIHNWPNWFVWLVIFSVILGIGLRSANFGSIPRGLNRDEAALAYNAYSLRTTGRDEHSQAWPVVIKSFGDQKLPGYVYSLIPFVSADRLTATWIRLPSLLAGLACLALLPWLTWQLIEPLQLSKQQRYLVTGFSLLTLAITPVEIHLSRVAYETNLAQAWFLLGTNSLLMALKSNKILNRFWLITGFLAWNLSILTYHSYQILIPVLGLVALIIFRKQLKKLDLVGLVTGSLITGFTLLLLWQGGVWSSNQVKQNGLALLSTQNLERTYVSKRIYLPGENSLLEKVIANKATAGVTLLAQNWLQVWSPNWLFITGSSHPDHNPGGMTNFWLYSGALLTLGLITVAKNYPHPNIKLLVAWLFLAPLPAALTVAPMHTTRAASFFPALIIVSSLGMIPLSNWNIWKNKLVFWFATALFAGFITLSSYFFYFNYQQNLTLNFTDSRHDRYHRLAQKLHQYSGSSDQVVTQSPSASPYIWYLVENKIDPQIWQSNHVLYPTDEEGFEHVAQVGNVYFETITWDDIEQRSQDKLLTLILTTQEFPSEKRFSDRYKLIETITNQQGQTEYEIWQIGRAQPK